MLSKILIQFVSDYLHILIFIDIILLIFVISYFKKSFTALKDKFIKNKIGQIGELRVLEELKALGLPMIHDAYIPMEKAGYPTQVDILVCFYESILVVEVKNIGGFIKGNLQDQQWLSVKGRHKHVFYNPIMQNNAHCHAVASLVNNDVQLQSAVVFCGNAKFSEEMPTNVFTLHAFLEYARILKKSQRPWKKIFGQPTQGRVVETWNEIRYHQSWLNKRALVKHHKEVTIKKYAEKIDSIKHLIYYFVAFVILLVLTYLQSTDSLVGHYANIIIKYTKTLF